MNTNNTTCYLFDDSQQSIPPVMSTCTGATTNHTSTQAPFVSHHNVLTTGVYYNAPPTPSVISQNNVVTITSLAAADSIITSTSSSSFSQNFQMESPASTSNSSKNLQMDRFSGLTSIDTNNQAWGKVLWYLYLRTLKVHLLEYLYLYLNTFVEM